MRKKNKTMVRKKKKKKTMMRNKKKKRKAQRALFTLTVLIHVSLALIFYNKPLHTLQDEQTNVFLIIVHLS